MRLHEGKPPIIFQLINPAWFLWACKGVFDNKIQKYDALLLFFDGDNYVVVCASLTYWNDVENKNIQKPFNAPYTAEQREHKTLMIKTFSIRIQNFALPLFPAIFFFFSWSAAVVYIGGRKVSIKYLPRYCFMQIIVYTFKILKAILASFWAYEDEEFCQLSKKNPQSKCISHS